MKIFKIESSIVFRYEEGLNLLRKKGEKIDKVVSGRVIREVITFFGLTIRVKYHAEYCYPMVDMENVLEKEAFRHAKYSVMEKCEDKVSDYYNMGR